MSAPVTAAELLTDPARVADVDPAALPALLAQLTTAAATVAARLSTIAPRAEGPAPAGGGGDRLLTAREAAVLLNLSTDFLYKHEAAKAFRVRIGNEVRFSLAASSASSSATGGGDVPRRASTAAKHYARRVSKLAAAELQAGGALRVEECDDVVRGRPVGGT